MSWDWVTGGGFRSTFPKHSTSSTSPPFHQSKRSLLLFYFLNFALFAINWLCKMWKAMWTESDSERVNERDGTNHNLIYADVDDTTCILCLDPSVAALCGSVKWLQRRRRRQRWTDGRENLLKGLLKIIEWNALWRSGRSISRQVQLIRIDWMGLRAGRWIWQPMERNERKKKEK